MSEEHGRGRPAYDDTEVKGHLRRVGPRKSSELAEEFGVSDVAIRKRLKQMDGVESRKVRNRLIWWVPHEEKDGGQRVFFAAALREAADFLEEGENGS